MNKRQKALKVMAEQAGLTPVAFDVRNSRNYLRCEADNGNQAEFWLACVTTLDPRAEQNELSRMKRFARNNAAPSSATKPAPEQEQQPTLEKTEAMNQKPAAPAKTAQVLDLSPVHFLRLSMWLNNQDLATYCNLDALALAAGKHLDCAVEESTILTAMAEVQKDAPARWSEPTDPMAIMARELARLLNELNVPPTDAFKRLAASLSL